MHLMWLTCWIDSEGVQEGHRGATGVVGELFSNDLVDLQMTLTVSLGGMDGTTKNNEKVTAGQGDPQNIRCYTRFTATDIVNF